MFEEFCQPYRPSANKYSRQAMQIVTEFWFCAYHIGKEQTTK
jgi:hypothetical protein